MVDIKLHHGEKGKNRKEVRGKGGKRGASINSKKRAIRPLERMGRWGGGALGPIEKQLTKVSR